jgi:RecA/RadA recombinase
MPRSDAAEEPITEQVKKHAKRPVEAKFKTKIVDRDRLVPSGSTMLNLACTDTIWGAYLLGEYTNIVGGFSTGKTSGSLEVFAACAQQRRFDDYDFIFDEPEVSNEFDMAAQFGKRAAARVKPPAYDAEGKPRPSKTVEDFEVNLRRQIKSGRSFIYVLDSFDALTSEQEVKKSDERVSKADRKKRGEETAKDQKKAAGSYGMEKAKGSSQLFRLITQDMKTTNSLLIVISQTRQEIDPMKQAKYRRSGGDAHDFYANHVIWLSCVEKIKDAKHKRELGNWVRAKVDKNKTTGKKRSVDFPSYVGYGIDDIDSMLDFLMVEGKLSSTSLAWKGQKHGSRKALITFFEENKDELVELRVMAGELWMEIEMAIKPDRRPKYT